MPLRLIFMGTPDFAVPTLRALYEQRHDILAVYTRAAKPAGRSMKIQPTPVEVEARRRNIRVFTPTTLRTPEAQAEFRAHGADAAVVVAYGLILPQPILDAPPLGCFNLHGSLLPRWRGAAPIERAVIAGENVSGVMVMKMDEGIDTGDIGLVAPIQITDHITAEEVREKLAKIGARLMSQTMNDLEYHRSKRIRQDVIGESYAKKIEKSETRIDWNRHARCVLRHIHGLSPSAWCEMPIGGQAVRVMILRCELAQGSGAPGTVLDDRLTVACGDGAIRILELQRAGKAPMSAADFLHGTPLKPPMRLS